jgi:thymidylate synthase
MRQYLDLLDTILTKGVQKGDRTGTGTLSVFGHQMRFDLTDGFPILTTKAMSLHPIACELLWFLKGDTNIRWLQEQGVHIWDKWADSAGDLGPIYGYQWRYWPSASQGYIDQIQQVVAQLKDNPNSRRIVVSTWNVDDLPDEAISPQENVFMGNMALAPCHCLFQFYVANRRLSCQVYQRSCDTFLGVPYNIASYALLTHLIAQQCDLMVGDLIWTGGDVHLYLNHLEQAKEQLHRGYYPLPRLVITHRPRSIFDFAPNNFYLEGYRCHPAIKAPISV